MSRIAVIFDLDGVLVDSWPVAQRSLALALSDVGHQVDVPIEAFRSLLGKPLSVIMRDLGVAPTAEPAFNFHALKLVDEVKPFPRIMGALAWLRQANVAIGVVTGKAHQRAVAVLDGTGLSPFVDALVTPDDAPGKPDPRALRQCLAAMRIDQALCFVGDTIVDSLAARAAAIPAARAAWGCLQPFSAADWDILLDTPDDIVHYVLTAL